MANLIEKCANKVIKWCFGNEKNIPIEQEELLTYGYTVFFENLYKALILLIIALLTKTIWETLLIIGSFALLRSFSGGIHSHSSLGCSLGMVGVWAIGLIVSRIVIPWPVMAVMGGIIIWTILQYAPRYTKNNPIRGRVTRKHKRVGSIVVMLVLFLIGIIYGVCLFRTDVLNMILTSMFIEAFSILLLVEKEENENEEDGLKESCRKIW